MPVLAALPDLGLLAAGVLLIILAFALYLLRDLITAAFSRVPVIGGWTASHLGGALDDAGKAVMHGADSAFHGAASLFRTVETWTVNVLHEITVMGTWAGQVIANIVLVQLPRLEHGAARDITSAFDRAWGYTAWLETHAARDLQDAFDRAWGYTAWLETKTAADLQDAFGRAWGYTAWLETRTAADLQDAFDRAWGYTAWLETRTAADLQDAFGRAWGYTAWLETKTAADLARGLSAAEAAAQAAAAAQARALVTDLDTWGNDAVAQAWPDAQGGLDALRQALGSAWPDLAKSLPYLEGLGAAGLLGALIRSMAGVNVLTRVMTDCVIPNCDNLGKLGKELEQLSSLPAAAAMLAWLTFLAADPVAAADDTVTVAEPLLDAVFGPLTDLISAGAEHL